MVEILLILLMLVIPFFNFGLSFVFTLCVSAIKPIFIGKSLSLIVGASIVLWSFFNLVDVYSVSSSFNETYNGGDSTPLVAILITGTINWGSTGLGAILGCVINLLNTNYNETKGFENERSI